MPDTRYAAHGETRVRDIVEILDYRRRALVPQRRRSPSRPKLRGHAHPAGADAYPADVREVPGPIQRHFRLHSKTAKMATVLGTVVGLLYSAVIIGIAVATHTPV